MKETIDNAEGLVRVYSSGKQRCVFKKGVFLQYAGLRMKSDRVVTFISHVVCIKQSNNTNADLPRWTISRAKDKE